MKLTFLTVVFSVLYGVEATADSTITCASCPSSISTNDIVTRSAVPAVDCTVPPLLVIVNGTMSTSTTTPTGTDAIPSGTGAPGTSETPVTAGSNKVFGSVGGAAAVAMAVVCLT